MLRGGAPALAWLHTGRIFLLGTAVNNVLPLRAGDVFRMFAFRNQPGLEPSRIGGTLIAERLLDLVALLAIFVIVLPFVPAGHSMGPLTTIASWAAALALLALIGVIALPSFERQVLGRLTGTPWIRSSPLLVEFTRRGIGACQRDYPAWEATEICRDCVPFCRGLGLRGQRVFHCGNCLWCPRQTFGRLLCPRCGDARDPVSKLPWIYRDFRFLCHASPHRLRRIGGNGGALCDHCPFAPMAPDNACRLRLFHMAGATRR